MEFVNRKYSAAVYSRRYVVLKARGEVLKRSNFVEQLV